MYNILYKILIVLIGINCLYFRHTSSIVVIPALVALGNIVAGDDVQTQVLLSTFFILLLHILNNKCIWYMTYVGLWFNGSGMHSKSLSSNLLNFFLLLIFCRVKVVIENQVLPRLLRFLTDEQTMEFIITSACWTISNIAAGNTEHVQVELVFELYFVHFFYN